MLKIIFSDKEHFQNLYTNDTVFFFLQVDVSMMLSIIISLLHWKIVEHFMNSARVCWIIKRNVFNVYLCLNHSWGYEHKQFERCDEKPRHQRHQSFFQNSDNFCNKMFSVNGKGALLVAFIRYTLLYTKL